MTIDKALDNNTLTITLDGRLDSSTAPVLEGEIKDSLDGVTELIFDLAGLEYISSAGLRVLLSSHKTMLKLGNMVVKNAGEEIMEIFEITGFSDVLNIE